MEAGKMKNESIADIIARLRPVAAIIAQYDATVADAQRVAEEQLDALGLAHLTLSDVIPTAAPPVAAKPVRTSRSEQEAAHA
jgi:hypothetical protein